MKLKVVWLVVWMVLSSVACSAAETVVATVVMLDVVWEWWKAARRGVQKATLKADLSDC